MFLYLTVMRFRKNQNVMYMDRGNVRPAKIMQYDPVTDSYVVQFSVNGQTKQRETVPDRVFSHPRNMNGYFANIERALQSIRQEINGLSKDVKKLQ